LAEKLRALGPEKVGQIDLIPGSGGVFEVVADGRLVYSKKQTGQHADPDALTAQLAAW
jgi:selenoprotein W-related protein